MKPRSIFSFCVALVCLSTSAGCNPFGTPEYEVRGRIVGFGDNGRIIIVEHQDVPGLMPAMTMPFQALDSSEIAGLEYGDAVQFTLSVSQDSSWIYDVTELPSDALPPQRAADGPPLTVRGEPILQPGDAVPAFELTNERGNPVRLEDYAGEAVLLNFIYTRCPLPEFCPLLSQRFASMQPVIEEKYGGQVNLLSVTIDPEYDTPDVLRDYAARYTDDLSTWRFATGEPDEIARVAHWFGVYYEPTETDVNHTLATALIAPDGRVHSIWRGNRWTTDEVMAEIEDMLGRKASPSQ